MQGEGGEGDREVEQGEVREMGKGCKGKEVREMGKGSMGKGVGECYITVGTFARRGLGSAKQRH